MTSPQAAPGASDLLTPDTTQLILASASPRRIDMLQRAGVPHAVHPTDVDETPQIGEAPEALVGRISRAKVDALRARYPRAPILGADTVVAARDCTLGKPAHEGAARQMLILLSGATHQVLTGYHLRSFDVHGHEVRLSRVVTTEVEVRPLSAEHIDGYLRSGEWRGKAGAYAVQGRFGAFVRAIRGSYDSVVGLPLCQVLEDLEAAGLLPIGWPTWKA